MRSSENIADLATALSKAQAEIEGAVKDKANPAFRSRYADLGNVWDAIRIPLTKNGLSVVQMPSMQEGNGEPLLITRLMHSSGQWLEGSYPLRPSKADPQGYGSAITYARRYALMAVLGVAPEDDDGNAASGRKPEAAQAAPAAKPAIAPDLKAKADKVKEQIDGASSIKALQLIMQNADETLSALPDAASSFLRDRANKRAHMLAQEP